MPTEIRYLSNGEEVNEFVLNRPLQDIEENLDEIFLHGIPQWQSNIEYQSNSFVKQSGIVYRGLNTSLNAPPNTSPSNWERWEGNRQATLNDRGTVTISNSTTSSSTTTAASSLAAKNLQDDIDVLSDTVQAIDTALASAVPSGVITMWAGAITAVPSGWALCDGNNGTPNLLNRFIVGAGGTYEVGDTGGANSVTLTTAQIPSHSHSASTGSAGSHSHSGTASSAGSHTHSGSAGSAGAHTHRLGQRTYNAGTPRPSYEANPLLGGTTNNGRGSTNPWSNVSSNYYRANSAGAHTHSLSINSNGSHTHSLSINSNGSHTHTVSVENTGSGNSHENRPPYYALAYIMKL